MRTPWVNILLLLLLLLQSGTGYLGMTSNREPEAWLLWLHGIGAYGLTFLLYFKSAIILDAWSRKKKWTRHRVAFVVLLVFLVLTLITGLLWTIDGPIYLAGFSLISIHIYGGSVDSTNALACLALSFHPASSVQIRTPVFLWRSFSLDCRILFVGHNESIKSLDWFGRSGASFYRFLQDR
jgi:hypothetical protein